MMTIRIDENLLGMWYYRIGEDSDWLGAVSRTEEGTYELVYRHRYYVDDKLGPDSEDVKSWYEGTLTPGPNEGDEEVIDKVRELVAIIANMIDSEVTELLVHDGDVEDFTRRLGEQEFAHLTKVH